MACIDGAHRSWYRKILVWGDGYYNGAIKTRKTVQPTEVSTEEASLHRSQQLRELYESLSIGEPNNQSRRPSASLSPEDLTDSEWFYLMCVSFSFPPGIGLPGKAYAKRQHIWLRGANEVDSKIFSRAILAKSARIQTVVCIPLRDGVVELGTTERVQENLGLVQRTASLFRDDVQINLPPLITGSMASTPPPLMIRPALSEHSSSNPPVPATSSDPPPLQCFHPALPTDANVRPTIQSSQVAAEEEDEDDEEEDDDDDNDDDEQLEELKSDAAHVIGGAGENASEIIMRMDGMSEVMGIGSPDDGSNHLDSGLNLLTVPHDGKRWTPPTMGPTSSGQPHQPPHSDIQERSADCVGMPFFDVLTQDEDSRYSQTVSTILENQSYHRSNVCSTPKPSGGSAFIKWQTSSVLRHNHHLLDITSQSALKFILFTVPFLHIKSHNDPTTLGRGGGGGGSHPQDELSVNHVMAERRRREKLNERFVILRSLVPFVTKMDKASILADTIEYVKQLRRKIHELESGVRRMEEEKMAGTSSTDNLLEKEKRKRRIVEERGGGKPKTAVQVDVSIIESDALVEIQCLHKEGLLLDVMQILRKFKIEVTAVQCSTAANGVFAAELRAKVKEGVNKPSIVEVKRAINQIILHH